jgi:hypothetical protein
MRLSSTPDPRAIAAVNGAMTWSFTGFHAISRYAAMSTAKNLTRKRTWGRCIV